MRTRNLNKREEIIDAAFRVWGRDLFGKMSLQDLTIELGVTKPSLYRHFRSKKDLIRAMTEKALATVQLERDDLVRITAEPGPLSERLRRAIYRHLELSVANLDVIHFSGYLYRKDLPTARIMERLNDETFESIGRNLGISIVAVHYLYALLVLVIFLGHLPGNDDCRLIPPEGESVTSLMQGRVEKIISLFNNGFKGSRYSGDPDFRMIFNRLDDFDYSAIIEDRILKAAYEALMEEGDLVTSLSRVAEKAGLKKSSLYSHFRSKEEMLTQALQEQKRRYLEAHNRFLESFATTEERFFANLAFSHGFIRRFPETIEMMDKLVTMDIFRDQDPELSKNKYFLDLIGKAGIESVLDPESLDPEALNYFINMIMIIEVRYLRFHPEMTDREKDDHIVRLYRIFIHGVEEFREVV
jgi:AcrR family transcriptional regulator